MLKNLSAKQEMWFQTLGQKAPLEKKMATHYCQQYQYSSIIAWEILETEKSGRLQSTALRRVRHNWAPTEIHLQLVNKTNNEISTLCHFPMNHSTKSKIQ